MTQLHISPIHRSELDKANEAIKTQALVIDRLTKRIASAKELQQQTERYVKKLIDDMQELKDQNKALKAELNGDNDND